MTEFEFERQSLFGPLHTRLFIRTLTEGWFHILFYRMQEQTMTKDGKMEPSDFYEKHYYVKPYFCMFGKK